MYTTLVVLLVIDSIALIVLIMLQQGKGADAGAAFGSGVSGTMFGTNHGGTTLSHITAGLATTFFVITLALAYLANHRGTTSNSVVDRVHAEQPAVPVAPAPAPAPAMQTGAPDTVTAGKATAGGPATTSKEEKPATKTGE